MAENIDLDAIYGSEALVRQRQSATAKVREWLRGDTLVLDVNACGAGDSEACEISVIDTQGNTLFSSIIQPISMISDDATERHGITNDVAQQCPTLKSYSDALFSLLNNRDVIIYNLDFNEQILRNSFSVHGCRYPSIKHHCAMTLFSEWVAQWDDEHDHWRYWELSDALSCFDGTLKGVPHRASSNCQAILDVLIGMSEFEDEHERPDHIAYHEEEYDKSASDQTQENLRNVILNIQKMTGNKFMDVPSEQVTRDKVDRVNKTLKILFDSGMPGEAVENDLSVDVLFMKAAALAITDQTIQVSLVERFFRIDYERAQKIINDLERYGVINKDDALSYLWNSRFKSPLD